jgi:hypothetical protein
MSEKPEAEEFEDEESEEIAEGPEEDLDVDKLMEKFDKRKRGSVKAEEPAWRKLERFREERHTAMLITDFDDYDIGDEEGPRRKKVRIS